MFHTLENWKPFSYSVASVRFAANGQFTTLSCAVVVGTGIVALVLALRGYDALIGAIG